MKTQTTFYPVQLINFEAMTSNEQIDTLAEQIIIIKNDYSYSKKNFKAILKQLKVISSIINNLGLSDDIGNYYNDTVIEIVENETTSIYNDMINKYMI